jgi:signal transduction histidine kinase
MKTISLKLYLIILIILIATACLLSTATFVLYQADYQSKQQTAISTKSIAQQLGMQRFRISKGFESPERFPDFDLWKESESSSGLCARFTGLDNIIVKSVCRGGKTNEHWPGWFENIYRWRFHPGQEIERQVTQDRQLYGTVTVSPSAEMELARAWHDVKKLMSLSAVTVVSLCSLLFFALGWALRPTRLTVEGLEKMAAGGLSTRLPDFKINEWQQTGQAINHLAESLEKTLFERKAFALKLVNAQEEERRYITRELHDEFGQSLAGLAAVASSITQTAENECPKLVSEGKMTGRITAHMMELLRGMLSRLRPVDFDELGLEESLKNMVAGWNARSGRKISYTIDIIGEIDHLPDLILVNIYRIIQECLTNISKHSGASHAKIKIERINQPSDCITLIIKDNGIVNDLKLVDKPGIGLLGIQERAAALGGYLTLQACYPSGLAVHIQIPLQPCK